MVRLLLRIGRAPAPPCRVPRVVLSAPKDPDAGWRRSHRHLILNRNARTMTDTPHATTAEMEERWSVLRDLEEWLQTPMMVLSFAWPLLVIVELVWGTTRMLEVFGTAIWITFIVEFTLRFALAP